MPITASAMLSLLALFGTREANDESESLLRFLVWKLVGVLARSAFLMVCLSTGLLPYWYL